MRSGNNIGVWVFLGAIGLGIVLLMIFAKPMVNWDSKYELKDEHPYGTSFIHELLKDRYGNGNFEVVKSTFDKAYQNLDTENLYTYIYLGYERDYDSSELAALLEFVSNGNVVLNASEYFNEGFLDTLLASPCRTWHISRDYFFNEEDSLRDSSLVELDVELSDDDEWDFEGEEVDEWAWLDEIPDTFDWDEASIEEVQDDSRGYWLRDYTSTFYSPNLTANFSQYELCVDSGYNFFYYYREDTVDRHWTYFNGECLDDNDQAIEVLGQASDEMINFIRIPFGDGWFYFHSNPLLFTNVELLDKQKLEYAEKLFSYIPDGSILWDGYIPSFEQIWDLNDADGGNPLSYILSEPPLRWSLYILLIAGLLFILFRAKRRQQFIPVVEPNINTSLEYVEMMGQLYYEQKDHRYIARQLWHQFMDFMRSYYYINPVEMKTEWTSKLAVKSQVAENKIKGIQRAYELTERQTFQESDLVNFYNKLKYFYSNCK